MGLDAKGAQFLLAARALGVSFTRTATIGRQHLFVTQSWLGRRLRAVGIRLNATELAELFTTADGFVEPLLHLLGADQVVSVDASDYEGATRVVDLNGTLPTTLRGAFSAVVDAGTLEHVFDFPAAVRNCMRMVEPNGHVLSITPANNMAGHGFYQFSPELFYRVFTEANGFRVERMLITEVSSSKWYEVSDPSTVGGRVQFRTFRPVYLCVAARRIAERPILDIPPQQSDYVTAWNTGARPPRVVPAQRYLPHPIAQALRSLYHFAQATLLPFDRRALRPVAIGNLIAPRR